MDIVLERILSLIPKKPDGKYVHGAKYAQNSLPAYHDGTASRSGKEGRRLFQPKITHEITHEKVKIL